MSCMSVLQKSIAMVVHKCGVLPSQHHPGQPVHRLNIPSKESQQSWPYKDIMVI